MPDERHETRCGGGQVGTLPSPTGAIFPDSIAGGRGRGTSLGEEAVGGGGAPASAIRRLAAEVAVLAALAVELGLAGGEEVLLAVRLAEEVEGVRARRIRGRLDRGEPGVRDRGRPQPGPGWRVVRVFA